MGWMSAPHDAGVRFDGKGRIVDIALSPQTKTPPSLPMTGSKITTTPPAHSRKRCELDQNVTLQLFNVPTSCAARSVTFSDQVPFKVSVDRFLV